MVDFCYFFICMFINVFYGSIIFVLNKIISIRYLFVFVFIKYLLFVFEKEIMISFVLLFFDFKVRL